MSGPVIIHFFPFQSQTQILLQHLTAYPSLFRNETMTHHMELRKRKALTQYYPSKRKKYAQEYNRKGGKAVNESNTNKNQLSPIQRLPDEVLENILVEVIVESEIPKDELVIPKSRQNLPLKELFSRRLHARERIYMAYRLPGEELRAQMQHTRTLMSELRSVSKAFSQALVHPLKWILNEISEAHLIEYERLRGHLKEWFEHHKDHYTYQVDGKSTGKVNSTLLSQGLTLKSTKDIQSKVLSSRLKEDEGAWVLSQFLRTARSFYPNDDWARYDVAESRPIAGDRRELEQAYESIGLTLQYEAGHGKIRTIQDL